MYREVIRLIAVTSVRNRVQIGPSVRISKDTVGILYRGMYILDHVGTYVLICELSSSELSALVRI